MDILVVGVGSMGRNHLRALGQLRSDGYVSRIYAVDVDKEKLLVAKEYGADMVFTDVNEAIKYRPDLGIIAVPTSLHYRVAKDLVRYMDLLIEKPITEKLSEALDLYREARALGRRVFVGHVERFNPAYRALLTEVANEVPVYMESIRVGPLRGNPQSYGNVLLDLGIHDIDLALGLVHERKVKVVGRILIGDPINSAWVMMRLGDATYTLHASWNYEVRVRRLTVMLRDRYYEADLLNKALVRNGERLAVEIADQLVQELTHVIRVLRGVEKPIIDIEDGIRALAVVEGIISGREEVDLDKVLGSL